MCFEFTTTNNQAEYKAFIIDLTLASEMGAAEIKLQKNSQLFVSQVKGETQTKDPLLQMYISLTRENLTIFRSHETTHLPRE